MFADAIVYYKIFDLTVAIYMKSLGSPEDINFFTFSDTNKKIKEYELQHDVSGSLLRRQFILDRPIDRPTVLSA